MCKSANPPEWAEISHLAQHTSNCNQPRNHGVPLTDHAQNLAVGEACRRSFLQVRLAQQPQGIFGKASAVPLRQESADRAAPVRCGKH